MKLIIFDVDGTLIDSQAVIIAAMRRAFEKADEAIPSDNDIRGIIGLSLEVAIATLLPEGGEPKQHMIAQFYRDTFIAMRAEDGGESRSKLFPGTRNMLETLKGIDSYLLGVATGKARRGLDHVYESHGIGQYFVTHQTADGHPSKPHPSMLEQALNETGCDARDAVIIGDTEFDMQMGRSAGFTTIGVNWGYHSVSRISPYADHILEDYDALPELLENIWGKP